MLAPTSSPEMGGVGRFLNFAKSHKFAHEHNDADRLQLRQVLLKGARSDPAAPVDAHYFSALRERVQKHAIV